MPPTVYFVIPCYNEEAVLPISAPVVRQKLADLAEAGGISYESRVLFVDDGSSDRTWELISALSAEDPVFTGVKLSHNAGEQNAYFAGMTAAVKHADAVVTMDCDLQDDINAVDEMIARFSEGYEIVYGVRQKRDEDPLSQRITSGAFYVLMRKLGTELVPEHSQFRLMSRRAVRMLTEYGEVNLFLPALVPKLGLKHTVVLHDRHARAAGKSNYTPAKLFRLAAEAVTSFSPAPLYAVTAAAALSALLFLASAVCTAVFSVRAGALSLPWLLLSSLWLVACLVFGSLRILGEYAYKTYMETKKRPRFQIETVTPEEREET